MEATKKSTYTAYVAIELLETDDVVFVCSACGEAMDLEDTLPPELSEREQAKARRAAEKEAKARAEAEAKRKARQAKEIDDELAALKRRLRDE